MKHNTCRWTKYGGCSERPTCKVWRSLSQEWRGFCDKHLVMTLERFPQNYDQSRVEKLPVQFTPTRNRRPLP